MERLTKRVLVVFGLCLLMAGSASADVVLNLLRGSYLNDGRFVVGRIAGSLSSSPGTRFDIFCDDYLGETALGRSFAVTITNLLNVADADSPVRYTGQGVLGYERAAWLITQMSVHPGETATIQHAIWALLAGTGAGHPALPPAGDNYYKGATGDWLAMATSRTTFPGVDFGSFRVLTPLTYSPLDQEFITKVPEPAMLGTLLFGLLGAGLFWRKRSIA